MSDVIYESLELLAERAGDITDQVYERYFTVDADSRELMAYVDPGQRGKMMDEILRLILVDDYSEEEGYLNWEVDNHEIAYSVKPEMYAPLFDALIDTVKSALGDDWSGQMEQAWQQRTEALKSEIVRRFGNS